MNGGELTTEAIASRVKVALESADLSAFSDLLDPNVRWGAPDDDAPACQNREQVLAWYRKGRDKGVRASVLEVVPAGDKILVGLKVTGRPAADSTSDDTGRWQVLTVGGGRVVDIRGFEDRTDAALRAHIDE